MPDSLQVTMGAGALHLVTQGTIFVSSTFIFDLEMQYLLWKCSVRHGQGSSRDPISQERISDV